MFFATQPFRTPRCSAEPTPPANIHTGPMDATASPTESVARENAEIAGHTPPPSLELVEVFTVAMRSGRVDSE